MRLREIGTDPRNRRTAVTVNRSDGMLIFFAWAFVLACLGCIAWFMPQISIVDSRVATVCNYVDGEITTHDGTTYTVPADDLNNVVVGTPYKLIISNPVLPFASNRLNSLSAVDQPPADCAPATT